MSMNDLGTVYSISTVFNAVASNSLSGVDFLIICQL